MLFYLDCGTATEADTSAMGAINRPLPCHPYECLDQGVHVHHRPLRMANWRQGVGDTVGVAVGDPPPGVGVSSPPSLILKSSKVLKSTVCPD